MSMEVRLVLSAKSFQASFPLQSDIEDFGVGELTTSDVAGAN